MTGPDTGGNGQNRVRGLVLKALVFIGGALLLKKLTKSTTRWDHARFVDQSLCGEKFSRDQASRDPDNYFNLRMLTCPATEMVDGSRVLYFEQAFWRTPQKPFRQRFYMVKPCPKEMKCDVEAPWIQAIYQSMGPMCMIIRLERSRLGPQGDLLGSTYGSISISAAALLLFVFHFLGLVPLAMALTIWSKYAAFKADELPQIGLWKTRVSSYAIRDAEEYKNYCDRPKDQRPQPEEIIGDIAEHLTTIHLSRCERGRRCLYEGSTPPGGFPNSWNGATNCTSELAVLKNSEIHTWDRGYDDEGNQVWGAKGGPYEFKPAPAPAVSSDYMFSPVNFVPAVSLGKKIEDSFIMRE